MLTHTRASEALNRMLELADYQVRSGLYNKGTDIWLGLGLANRSQIADTTKDELCIPQYDGSQFYEPSYFTTTTVGKATTTVTSGTVTIDDIDAFKSYYATMGTYTFTFSNSGWADPNGNVRVLSDIGLTLTGTPAVNNTITVELYIDLPYTHYARRRLTQHKKSQGYTTNEMEPSGTVLCNPIEGVVQNTDEMQFVEAQEVWGNILYFGIFTSETGGTPIMYGTLTDETGSAELTNPVFVGPRLYSEGGVSGNQVKITMSASTGTATVVERTFRNYAASDFHEASYIFTYDSDTAKWYYNEVETTLSLWGITYTGSPVDGTTITAAVTIDGTVVLFRQNQFKVSLDPIDETTGLCLMNITLKNSLMEYIFGFKETEYVVTDSDKLYLGLGTNSEVPVVSGGVFTKFVEPTFSLTGSATSTMEETYTSNPADYSSMKTFGTGFSVVISSIPSTGVTISSIACSGTVGYSDRATTPARAEKTISFTKSSSEFIYTGTSHKLTFNFTPITTDIMDADLTFTVSYTYNEGYQRKLLVYHLIDSSGTTKYTAQGELFKATKGYTYNKKNIQFKEATSNWGNMLYIGIFTTETGERDSSTGYSHPIICGKLTDAAGTPVTNPVPVDGSQSGKVALFRDHQFKFSLDRPINWEDDTEE